MTKEIFTQAIQEIIALGKDDEKLATSCLRLTEALIKEDFTAIADTIKKTNGILYHLPWSYLSDGQRQQVHGAVHRAYDYLHKVKYNWGTP